MSTRAPGTPDAPRALMSEILVVFATTTGTTRTIADRVARRLVHLGHRAAAVPAHRHGPPAASFDAVVVGSPQWLGRHPRAIVDFVTANRAALTAMPTAYFSVGAPARLFFGGESAIPQDHLFQMTGWHPQLEAEFASSLRARAAAWLIRRVDAVEITSFADRFGDALRQRIVGSSK